MTTELSGREADSNRIGFPVRAAVLLLGIYAAMHLCVGGLLKVLSPSTAIARGVGDPFVACTTAYEDGFSHVDRTTR